MNTATRIVDDVALREAVESELQWAPEVTDGAGIGVCVRRGVVTLSGEVTTFAEKLAAGRVALRTVGVTAVANEVRVRYRSVSDDDTQLATEARDALLAAPYVPCDRVDVEVREQVLYLSGTVEWGHERIAAERAVEALPGVRFVRNDLTVRPRVAADDVVGAIGAEFNRIGSDDSEQVVVDVDGHDVTLSGSVGSYGAWSAASRAASSVKQVDVVHNELRIVRP